MGQSFAEAPKMGDKAPQFSAKDETGTEFKSADIIGKKPLILYFYPQDNTPGCTTEACGLRDRMGDLKKQGVEVVGVSFDSPESHQKFIADHKLNFKLVSDTDGKVADMYGARNGTAKKAKRISFLIDSTGKVVHITDNRDAGVHLQEMKEAVAKLK
jgi:peroxiredoxin Q/BCP